MKKMITFYSLLCTSGSTVFLMNCELSTCESEVTKDLSDYNKAVIGHVITNMSDIDKRELLENELDKIGHQYAFRNVRCYARVIANNT